MLSTFRRLDGAVAVCLLGLLAFAGILVAPTAGGLMLGQQHRPVDIGTAFGPREQIGVGGTGFGDDVELTPRQAGPDQPVTQGSRIQGRSERIRLHRHSATGPCPADHHQIGLA